MFEKNSSTCTASLRRLFRFGVFNGRFAWFNKFVDPCVDTVRLRLQPGFVIAGLCLLLLASSSPALSAGLTQHQFMADLAAPLVSIPELEYCLVENRDAYLVGAPFPDAGYAILNDPMSSDAHSTQFIDAFVTHIKTTYSPPYTEQYMLISFLMGAASHVADDPPYHWYFIDRSADEDFGGNYDLAHTMCDVGLEFLAIVDHNRWFAIPQFWLPIDDIVGAFNLMGSNYREIDILLGNLVILVADYAERLIAPFAYFPVMATMPWTASNYYYYPDGGLCNGGEVSAEYYESVWNNLMSENEEPIPAQMIIRAFSDSPFLYPSMEHRDPLYEFVWECLADGMIEVDVIAADNGSVIINQPRINFSEELFLLIDSFIADLVS